MASSVPVVELGKKRKREESSSDAVSKRSDDEPDSDFACEAPAGGNTCSTVSGKRLQSGIQPSTYVKSNTPVSSNCLLEESANKSKSDSCVEEATALEEEVQPTVSSASVALSSDAGVQRSGPPFRTREDDDEDKVTCRLVDSWSPLVSALSYAFVEKTRVNLRAWVVGNSFVREAVHLLQREQSLLVPGCMNFYWLGVEDLSLSNLRNVIVFSAKKDHVPTPDYLVVHAGGNDLLNLDRSSLTRRIHTELLDLLKLYPQAFLLWSEIIPRRKWVAEGTPATSELSIRKVNGIMRAFTKTVPRIQNIRHGLLFGDNSFDQDGVRLSKAGSRVFISNIVWAVRLASLSSVTAKSPVGPQAL